jgi:hypothetical protein
MFEQLRDAILPASGLRQTLQHWGEFTEALADTPRKRQRQMAELTTKLS